MARPRIIRAAAGAALIALGLALLVALAGVWSFMGPGPAAPQGEATVVVLERGSGLSRIADTLEAAEVISSAKLFALGARLTGAAGELKAGE